MSNIIIDRIKVSGFKNVVDSDIRLDKITGLVSANSYGKSNLLNAIDFGIYFIKNQKHEKRQMMRYSNGMPMNRRNPYKNYEFEIELTIKNSNEHKVIYGYQFEWNKGDDKHKGIILEYLKIKGVDDLKYTTFISRDNEKKHYKSSQTGRCDKDILVDADELILNKISNFDELYYLDIVKSLNEIIVYVDKDLDMRSTYYPDPFLEKDITDLMIAPNKNIPRVLFHIKKTYPNKFELIINTIKSLFPFIEDIHIKETVISEKSIKTNITSDDEYIRISDRVYHLYVEDVNLARQISLLEMSDGIRRILLLFTYVVLAQINNVSLIMIEEPENSINPGLLRKLIIALDNFLEYTKVIITSHSPYIANYLDLESIYIGEPNKERLAKFKSFKPSNINKILSESEDLDMLVGEYIFELLTESSYKNKISKYLSNE